jgi:hypothetical protein
VCNNITTDNAATITEMSIPERILGFRPGPLFALLVPIAIFDRLLGRVVAIGGEDPVETRSTVSGDGFDSLLRHPCRG